MNPNGTSAVRLAVDRTACAGHGLCYGRSPDVLDCDDQGDPIVRRDPIEADTEVESARAAALVCPERALTVESI